MSSFEEKIPEILLAATGEKVISTEPIPTGKHNTSFFVKTPAGEYVIRIAPPDDTEFLFYEVNMMAQEPEIHALLREKTDVPVARVVAFDHSRSIIDRDYIIMDRLEGVPLSQVAVDADGYETIMEQIGTHLARVHSLTSTQYGYIGAHRPMPAQTTWWDAFRLMWNKLIDDILRIGMYTQDERDRLLELLDENKVAFDRPVASSLLHMDIWSQNILVNRDLEVTGIVDWDRALWGDPEIEYAVLDYCGISAPAFWRGYGRQRDSSPEAEIRHVFYYLYEHQKYILIRLKRRDNPAAAAQYKEESLRILNRCFGF